MQYAAANNVNNRATGGGGSGNAARYGRVSYEKTKLKSFLIISFFHSLGLFTTTTNR